MPDSVTYVAGHVKHNAETNEVAIRTIFPEDAGGQMASMTWLICTTNMGARNAKTDEVVNWDDLYVPPPGG